MSYSPELHQKIQDAFSQFEQRPFPDGHRSKEYGGKTLTTLQSEIAGFILTYLGTQGSLGSRQVIQMRDGLKILEEAIPTLEQIGQEHFGELLKLGQLVLESAHDQPV